MKYSKDFTPEQIQKMVIRVFPEVKITDFYNKNNYYQFNLGVRMYSYYFIQDCLDSHIDIFENIKNEFDREYICTIVFEHASYFL